MSARTAVYKLITTSLFMYCCQYVAGRKCVTKVNLGNWTATTKCNISTAFSAIDQLQCKLLQRWESHRWRSRPYIYAPKTTLPYIYLDLNATETYHLTKYTHESSGTLYSTGHCNLTWDLPSFECMLSATVIVYPGPNVNYVWDDVVIGRPTSPTHNCQYLHFLPEDGTVQCVCTASSLGRPNGRLIWYSGDTILSMGAYNATRLPFPFHLVDRQHDGEIKRCELDWVEKENVYVTEHVAYGPDRVELQYWQQRASVNSTVSVIVICSVHGVNPLTSDMIQWSGLCQGQTGFTCMITLTASEGDGKDVTCTAVNAENNGHRARASVNIKVEKWGEVTDDNTDESTTVTEAMTDSNVDASTTDLPQVTESSSDGMATGIVIGAGAVFGVVFAVVAVVLTVLWRKGRLPVVDTCCGSVCNTPSSNRRQHEDASTASGRNTRPDSSSAGISPTGTSAAQEPEPFYESMAFDSSV